MELPDPLVAALRKVAGWLDDRYTVAAVGLVIGHFGLSDAQWTSLETVITTIAAFLLVVVPDPKLKQAEINAHLPPIDLASRFEPDGVQQSGSEMLPQSDAEDSSGRGGDK